ncbi:MAG: restriction endonuclease subunit S [Nostoc sp.]|uniref:restriction endonuclease subunit S n=1 Tax=Nostoc sp. TaxID=1180 RepID=UPI002FF6546B
MKSKLFRKGWKNTTLGKVLTFQRGFDITKKQLQPGEYDMIFSSGLGGKHNEYKVKAPGVVIGRKGTIGTVFFAKSNFWATDTTLWVKDFHSNDEKFAYYFLQILHLEQYDCGSANPTLNRNHIHELPVCYPPLPTQKKIADMLSAYDDLIENNTRRIKILEEMAQTLYHEWFVKFRFPGHEHTKMVDSELGLIPEEWEVRQLSEVCQRITDGSHWSPKSVDKGYPMASVKDMHNWVFQIKQCRIITEDDYNKLVKNDCKTLKNDVIVAKDGSYLKHIFVVE